MPDVAFEQPGFRFTLEAAADLSAGQYRALVVDGSGDAARAGQGVSIAGIQQNKPSVVGQATEIVQTGISKGESGAAVLQGAKLMTDASGKFVTATATDFVIGYALTASGADGEVIAILLSAMDIAA